MELWIRSQDRTTLIKCGEIYIADITSNYLIREVGSSHTLGAYKTIDKALEVLDEIQIEISKFLGTAAEIVYEMPEE